MSRENNTSTRTLPRNSKILWQEPRSRPQSYAEPGDGVKEIEMEAASKSSSNIHQTDSRAGNTQQRRQPSRYRHRTERGRRERREGSKNRDGRSRSRGRENSGERNRR